MSASISNDDILLPNGFTTSIYSNRCDNRACCMCGAHVVNVPYAGKFWRGKILANLAINANSPNFFLLILIKTLKLLKIFH